MPFATAGRSRSKAFAQLEELLSMGDWVIVSLGKGVEIIQVP